VQERIKTLEVIQAIRKGFQANTIDRSKAYKEQYLAKVEDTKIAGVPVFIATPKKYIPQDNKRILIYFHGVAFCLGLKDHFHHMYAEVAAKTNSEVVFIDYRLAPEQPLSRRIK